jgi:hypothetical protein
MKMAIDIPQFISPPRSGRRHYISQSADSQRIRAQSRQRRLNLLINLNRRCRD